MLPAAPPDEWMRHVAREMNLSETAFLTPRDGGYQLRWFTPAVEVDLCGHATVASAHVLWEDGHLPADRQARFHTRSGLLLADRRGEWIELDFPAKLVEAAPAPAELLPALGSRRRRSWAGTSSITWWKWIPKRRCALSTRTIRRCASCRCAGVIVTARSGRGEYDFVSRFFAPGSGIDEDPVTGSAHCALGPYWSERLGKSEFTAFQASARGGVVRVRLRGRPRHAGRAGGDRDDRRTAGIGGLQACVPLCTHAAASPGSR